MSDSWFSTDSVPAQRSPISARKAARKPVTSSSL